MMNRATVSFLSAGVLLMAVITSGCSTNSPPASPTPPAVCSAIDSLKSSVAAVTNVNLDQGALPELKDNLAQVKSDVSTLKDDATDEFAPEIDAVDKASASVGSSVDAATASPSVQSITDVGTALQALGSSLRALEDAVKGTC